MIPFPCIAISGGIAEGKSTVLGYLARAGYRVASADEAAREVYARPDFQAKLAALLNSRNVDREELREAMAANASLRRRVNRLMHPPILEVLLHGLPQFVEIPLLIEDCLHASFAEVWVVTCGESEQFRRLARRIGDESLAARMLSVQLPTRVKVAFADRIVRTNEPEEAVNDFVIRVVEKEIGWQVASL